MRILLVAALLLLSSVGPFGLPEEVAPVVAAEALPGSLETRWWEWTAMDRDRNRMHDALDLALLEPRFVVDGRVEVLVDFDHMPAAVDAELLAQGAGFEVSWRFHRIPIIAGSVTVDRLPELLALPGVVFLTHNSPVELQLDGAIPEHNVDTVWDLGFDGTGITVAIIDTGIDPDHLSINDMDDDAECTAATIQGVPNPPCQKKIIAFYDALDEPRDGNDTSGNATPYDDHGHGSHCAGISAGTGEGSQEAYGALYRGAAPGAQLVGVKVLSGSGSGSFVEVMRGLQWTIDNQEKYNIRAASMSLGGVWVVELTQEQEERVTHLANLMVAAGIALTIAAGNSAAYGTIGTPGAARDVITVGATEHDRELAIYSSKGPTHEGYIKPNIAAIGSSVWSVQNDDAVSGEATYVAYSGTSMATPLVAGMVALLNEANPDLSPLMVRAILESTSEYRWLSHPVRPNNDYGWGFPEVDAALVEAQLVDPTINLSLDPQTPQVTHRETYDDGNSSSEVNITRWFVRQDGELHFLKGGPGNATAIEWRNVLLYDSWHTLLARDGHFYVPLENSGLEPGNHTLWVRLAGPEGISAPVGITIHLAEPLPDSGAVARLPLLLLAGVMFAVGAAASIFFWRRSASS
ncbi:MAG: hypothetical protein BEU05_02075 [Marine Group III euryarchaeote CG-Bathy2]|uniref:Peptidase S8/S53 domain-containing protein n=1 Tax=Marine Group III euryarchaeote CG-Bathy2 TaxID=1889002 RepID=A0A1J5SNV4_9ARCH|nr:MAG: hypothetical protein BEU05_02075 [Marine Group III euryarchaeote CG-Bathy2]